MGDLIPPCRTAAGAVVVVPGAGLGVLAGRARLGTLVAPSRADSLPGPASHRVHHHRSSGGKMSVTFAQVPESAPLIFREGEQDS